MSTPTHLAALEDIQDSTKWLKEVIAGLSAEALNWAPAPGTNSIAVLVRHALPSTRFWVSTGSGLDPSHREYVESERTPAFETTDATPDELISSVDATLTGLEHILRGGSDEHLTRVVTLDDEGERWTGSGCLVHAASHLREHAGQAALTRDLWLARGARKGQ